MCCITLVAIWCGGTWPRSQLVNSLGVGSSAKLMWSSISAWEGEWMLHQSSKLTGGMTLHWRMQFIFLPSSFPKNIRKQLVVFWPVMNIIMIPVFGLINLPNEQLSRRKIWLLKGKAGSCNTVISREWGLGIDLTPTSCCFLTFAIFCMDCENIWIVWIWKVWKFYVNCM